MRVCCLTDSVKSLKANIIISATFGYGGCSHLDVSSSLLLKRLCVSDKHEIVHVGFFSSLQI